jgi:aminomethyltransferase
MEERGIPRSHYDIQDESGNKIGEVTSGTQSPTLGVGIGLGYVKTEFATPGTNVFINVRNKPLKAKVVKLPFVTKGA